jgi:hypothetical protein
MRKMWREYENHNLQEIQWLYFSWLPSSGAWQY